MNFLVHPLIGLKRISSIFRPTLSRMQLWNTSLWRYIVMFAKILFWSFTFCDSLLRQTYLHPFKVFLLTSRLMAGLSPCLAITRQPANSSTNSHTPHNIPICTVPLISFIRFTSLSAQSNCDKAHIRAFVPEKSPFLCIQLNGWAGQAEALCPLDKECRCP